MLAPALSRYGNVERARVHAHVWLQELTCVCVCVSQGLLVHMQKHAEEEADLEP